MSRLRFSLIAPLSLMLVAACGPGDLMLSASDHAQRAGGVHLRETVQKKVPFRGSRSYAQSCPSGMRMTDGSARISNVAGSWNSASEYQFSSRTDLARNRVSAVVSHLGNGHPENDPFVVVEFRMSCMPGTARG